MNSWRNSIKAFLHPRVITMLFFGFSAGIPLLLIFSSLGLWLREAGVDRSTATMFSWAALGYSFKFVWAPIVDCLPVPYLTRRLGRRRAWILMSQFAIISAILLMAMTDPASDTTQLKIMALAAVILGFSSATQDIVIDAYRIESAATELQALMSSTYITGYRLGMIVSGAGSLFIASYLGTKMNAYSYDAWQSTYFCMSIAMLVGVITTLTINEPKQNLLKQNKYKNNIYVRLLLVFIISVIFFILFFQLNSEIAASWKNSLTTIFKNHVLSDFFVECARLSMSILAAILATFLCIKLNLIEKKVMLESYVEPIANFFKQHGLKLALLLLVLIGLYRISDIVLGVIANIFYQDLGFSKYEIASASKTFGLIMAIIGGIFGGVLTMRFGIMRILFAGALLTVLTNLLFMVLAMIGNDITVLYVVIGLDSFSAGIASAVFIAFLSRLTNISFTATQYALFSSLMTLIPKTIGGYSGSIVDNIGYTQFFLFASLLGIPVLFIIWLANKHLTFE